MSNPKETARTMIKILTGHERVIFTTRCNASIKLALKIVIEENLSNVLFQEEGGWLTYEKFINKANLNPVKLVTDDGLIYPGDLEIHDLDSALLINSLAGYIAPQNMDEIVSSCFKNNIFLINDVSGSIGTKIAKLGEVIIGSFGKGKPVDLGEGGFISVANESLFEYLTKILGEDYIEPELNYVLLVQKLKNLEKRINHLHKISAKVKSDLSDMNIVHKDKVGFNVVVRFDSPVTREKIINYCNENNFEYTVCPREIRILDDAISIEVKRLTEKV